MVREKTRHLLLELIWKDERRGHNMSKQDFGKLLHKALKRLYGALGTAEFPQNLSVRYFDGSTNLCILRCNRAQKTQVICLYCNVEGRAPIEHLSYRACTVCEACRAHVLVACVQLIKPDSPSQPACILDSADSLMFPILRCPVNRLLPGGGSMLHYHRIQSSEAPGTFGEGERHYIPYSEGCNCLQ